VEGRTDGNGLAAENHCMTFLQKLWRYLVDRPLV